MTRMESKDIQAELDPEVLKMGAMNSQLQKRLNYKNLIYVRYRDHVLYHRVDPALVKPQFRECVGWLVYECEDYIVMSWDRDADPPTLKGGDPKASGLTLLKRDILELRHLT